jgi:hypothetical protein
MLVLGAILSALAVAMLLLALILWLIARMLFRRKPSFGNWQPPYATMPSMDPNSTYGRRQLWQQHAQNNALPLPCKDGSIQARKVLLGRDGYYLSGWKIKAARLTQYDMYGRVSRSQVLAPPGMVRRLNGIARRSATLERDRIERRVRPTANRLAKQFRKKVSKRSAMLPVALDVRLQGSHGEVRILFELYQCQRGQQQQIDAWEPEMIVVGKTIQESYTFTIAGQTGETFYEFRKRLKTDLTRVLADMLSVWIPGAAPGTATITQPVQINYEV